VRRVLASKVEWLPSSDTRVPFVSCFSISFPNVAPFSSQAQAHNLRQPHTSSLHVHQVHQGPPRTTKAVWHGCVKVLLVHASQSRSDGSRQAVRRRGATKGSQRQPREDDSHQISPSRWLAAPITGPNCIIVSATGSICLHSEPLNSTLSSTFSLCTQKVSSSQAGG
jgi:hypothetical protein